MANNRNEEEIFEDDADSRSKRKAASVGLAKQLSKQKEEPLSQKVASITESTKDSSVPTPPKNERASPPPPPPEDSTNKLKEYTEQLMEMNRGDSDLSERLSKLSNRLDEAKREYDSSSNINRWSEVAETIGQALVRIGAAQAGGSKWDSSGLPMSKTDWDRKQERIDRKYAGDQSSVASQQEGLLSRASKQEEGRQRTLTALLKEEQDNLRQAALFKQQGEMAKANDARREAADAKREAARYAREMGLVKARGEEDRKTQAEKPVKGEEASAEKRQAALGEGLSQAASYQDADAKTRRQLAPKIAQNLGRAGLNPSVSSFLTNPEKIGASSLFKFDSVDPEEVADGVIAGISSEEDVNNLNKLIEPYAANPKAAAKVLQARALFNRGGEENQSRAKTLIDEAKALMGGSK